MLALIDQMLERPGHPLQAIELISGLREPLRCDATDRSAVGAVLQPLQFGDLFQRETKLLRAADEDEPRGVSGPRPLRRGTCIAPT